jgi:hypothetical protein
VPPGGGGGGFPPFSPRRFLGSGDLLPPAPLLSGLLASSRMDLANLDFWLGIVFEDSLRLCLASSVCPARPSLLSSFWLVVSFGRCIFKLNSDSVGYLLQAALRGFAAGFEVLQLSDRVFQFSVSSKAVGFHIYNSKCIDRAEFRAFSIFGTMVALTGFMNSRNLLMRRMLPG